MTIDMSQFFQVFFDEAAEHLANMEGLLLGLNVEDPSIDELNAVFRAAHSIKGGAGTFGFTDIAGVTHILENLLDRLRRGELKLVTEMVDAFLAAGDVLKGQLEAHRNGGTSDPATAEAVCKRLEGLTEDSLPLSSKPPSQPVSAVRSVEAPQSPVSLPETVGHMLADVSDSISRRPGYLSISFKTESSDTDLEKLWAKLRELGSIDVRQRPSKKGKKISGCWEVELATSVDSSEVRDLFEFVISATDLEIRVVDGEQPTPAAAKPSDSAYGFFDDAPGNPEAAADSGYGFFDGSPGSPPGSINNDGYGFFENAPGLSAAAKASATGTEPSKSAPHSGQNLEGNQGLSTAPAATATVSVETEQRAEGAPAKPRVEQPTGTETKAGRREQEKAAPVAAASGDSSSIRVGVEKVDQLINLVGELVITQSMIAQMASEVDPVIYEKLMHGLDQLERNTRGLQESVMSIRMMPIAFVFSRFPRVVRDLASKLNKKVELKTVGEGTELDKGVIEKIADPLTHLVRNSLDHGVESPEKRLAAGKPETGSITLKAFHQSGYIVIEVIDDGGGLSRDRILAKARERGMAVSDAMSDGEVWQLIFEAGFSTAEKVTDVSGRGVGMDVVKRNISAMNGRIDIDSALGHGTRISIRLPLTLAILDGMSIEVGGELFIVPLTLIIESFQPTAEDLTTVRGNGLMVKVRGEYLPVIALHEVFGLKPRLAHVGKGIILIVESEGRRVAMLVDELVGQHQVVIKSLDSNYKKVPGFSGATIMGDGRVALILDVSTVVQRAGQQLLEAA